MIKKLKGPSGHDEARAGVIHYMGHLFDWSVDGGNGVHHGTAELSEINGNFDDPSMHMNTFTKSFAIMSHKTNDVVVFRQYETLLDESQEDVRGVRYISVSPRLVNGKPIHILIVND